MLGDSLPAACPPLVVAPAPATGQEAAPPPPRPALLPNRYDEDWSVLADRRVSRDGGDTLKYIALAPGSPRDYLSLGVNARVRYEANDAPLFGLIGNRADGYAYTRIAPFADLRIGRFQLFSQLDSAFAADKRRPGPPDADRLDLEQAFVGYTVPVGGGRLTLRAGRQEFAFDRERFVSTRDNPNVRRAFDALWGSWTSGPWRVIAYASHPVVIRDTHAFDDRSGPALTFSGLRVERRLGPGRVISAYVARFTQGDVTFGGLRGDERRTVLDLRATGHRGRLDWDLEAMGQTGSFAGRDLRAWAVGTVFGYTLGRQSAPRLGMQIDLASGDSHPGDQRLTTFNPLFPNGSYFQLAGYTGYANLIHMKPSVTLHPTKSIAVLAAVAAQWRMTRADAIYVQLNQPLAGTAGQGSGWTGGYGQFHADWRPSPRWSFAVELDRFEIGDTIRRAGGRDATLLGIEASFGF